MPLWSRAAGAAAPGRSRPATALGEHGGGGAVPQPVRVDRAQPGPLPGREHGHRDPTGRQAPVRRLDPDEHAAVQGRGRPAPPQPVRDCLACVGGQREAVATVSLTGDGDLAAPPVDVVQAQPGDLARAQPKPRQQRHHRQITASACGPQVTGGQQGPHLRRLQRPRKPRPPVGHRGNRPVQRPADQALHVPEPQQRTQRRRQPLSGLRGQPPRLAGQERRDIARRQPAQIRAVGRGVADDERPDRVHIAADNLLPQAALGQQIAPVPLEQRLRLRRRRGNLRLGSHAQFPQVAQQRRQRLRRPVGGIPSRPACRQILLGHRPGQRHRAQPSSSKPPAQVGGQPQLGPR
jgi:hypothetical protein